MHVHQADAAAAEEGEEEEELCVSPFVCVAGAAALSSVAHC